MPRVVRPRALRQADLANNLRPHVQRRSRLPPLSKRQRRPNLIAFVAGNLHLVNSMLFFGWKSTSPIKSPVLLPINEIGKRTLHSFEHAPRFVLRPAEGILDPCFDAANDPPFTLLVVVGFHVFHGRAGKHPLCAPDRAAVRADVDRANWTRRSI